MKNRILYSGFLMAAALTVFLASFSLSFAYRPFTTEDAGVAGKGIAQFEISWDYLKWRNGNKNNVLLFVPIYGLTEKIELSVEVPYIFSNPSDDDHVNGVGDTNLVGKYLLFAEKELRPAFTLKGVVKTNSGDEKKGLGSGDTDYSIVAVASKGISALTLHAMLGYTLVGDNGDENIRNIYLYGIAADYALTEKFHCVAEINGNQNPDRRITEHPFSSLLGITYKVSDMIMLDGGVRYGFNDSVPRWNTTAALAFLVVLMLFIPCVATLTVMKKEMGSMKWFASSLLLMLLISFSGGIIAYRVALWTGL